MNTKRIVIVCFTVAFALLLFGCPDDAGSDTNVALSVAQSCTRVYGDGDCRLAASALAVGDEIGSVTLTGVTASGFAITAGDTAGTYAISDTGVITVATALTVDADYSQALTVSITPTTGSAVIPDRTVTITNVVADATLGTAPLTADRGMNSPGGNTLTITMAEITDRCGASAPCVSSVYTGGFGGWFYGLEAGTTSIDLSAFENAYIVYNAPAGTLLFEFKMESEGVGDGQYVLNGEGGRIGITADDAWQTAVIPTSALMGLLNGSGGGFAGSPVNDATGGLDLTAITVPVGIWNQGANNTLMIDEVYFR